MTEVLPNGETADVAVMTTEVLRRLDAGDRFVGLFATATPELPVGEPDRARAESVTLHVATANDHGVALDLAPVGSSYPCLTTKIPPAFWYERVVHDLFGVVPDNHPRLDPLVLPLQHDERSEPEWLPRPGSLRSPHNVVPDERAVPRHVHGPGLFTIPHGPVRSGVMESVEYLVETPGEDIPHLQVRVFAKHRGVERSFQGWKPEDGVLLAERTEGISGVAHALAFSHAIESAAGVVVPKAAAWIRVLHAELERLANHLDVAVKLTDAAGLAVAVARFSMHKERLLRLRHQLSGNRFGRGVVAPGGVTRAPAPLSPEHAAELATLERDVSADARLLMTTSSFLDRLRGTGPLDGDTARVHGAVGPVGKGSGYFEDARLQRPYDAYQSLPPVAPSGRSAGDALARLDVRWHEVREAFTLIEAARQQLADHAGDEQQLRSVMPSVTGRGVGWAESAQGEVVYVVDLVEGRITRCWPRSASLHNLSLFHEVFAGDILTDFPFIEASFGLSIAGVVL